MKQISKAEFGLATEHRYPKLPGFTEEVEWWQEGPLVGIVALDKIDSDWSWAALGPDEVGVYRAVEFNASCTSTDEARAELHEAMTTLAENGKVIFPQGDPGN